MIDDLLSQEALEKLRRYCWGSTIWRETHPEGYLTAMPEHGLVCPLIAQIDEDMRAAYPGILGTHLLRYLWAFKYDSKLHGVGTHADPSLVTFNFWITPDEANLDPEHGGLTVWDAAAPADWNSQRTIGDTAGCQAYLARMGAKSVTIPYRSNRAIVFSSALFHETDRYAFPGRLYQPAHQRHHAVRKALGHRGQRQRSGVWFLFDGPAFCDQRPSLRRRQDAIGQVQEFGLQFVSLIGFSRLPMACSIWRLRVRPSFRRTTRSHWAVLDHRIG